MAQAQNKTSAQRLKEAAATDPWISDDIQIDWSGVPSMRPLPQDESFIDSRFSPLSNSADEYLMRGGDKAQGLRAFVEQETSRATAPNAVNLGKGIVGKVSHDGQQYACEFAVDGKAYRTKATVYDDCVMQAARFLFNRKPDIRELTAEEKQLVIWTAQGGRALDAAQKWVELSCPGATEQQLMSDPKYLRVFDEGAWYGWAYSHNEYSLSDKEFPRYLKKFARGKTLSLALIDSAFGAYKAETSAAQRSALFNPQPQPEPELNQQTIVDGLEEMSDAQLNDTMKRYVRSQAGR
jgi:hypothetical protein